MRLTKKAIDAARCPHGDSSKRRFLLWDDELAGFGLRVFPSGREVLIFSYRVAGRKQGVVLDDQLRTISTQAGAAIRLLLFTGARKNEILTPKWENITAGVHFYGPGHDQEDDAIIAGRLGTDKNGAALWLDHPDAGEYKQRRRVELRARLATKRS